MNREVTFLLSFWNDEVLGRIPSFSVMNLPNKSKSRIMVSIFFDVLLRIGLYGFGMVVF